MFGDMIDVGSRFGAWTVIGPALRNRHNHICWCCRCDCGLEKIVQQQSLKGGYSTQCNSCARRNVKLVPIEERFWKHIYPDPNCGCWIWDGSCDSKGYGQLRIEGKNRTATRVSWELFRGPIPNGMNILHRCDFPPCVNPDHLFLGTQRDNMRDAMTKGRMNITGLSAGRQKRPEYRPNHSQRKLTVDQILEIRASSIGKRKLSQIYGVTPRAIQQIKKYLSYREL